MISRKQEPLPGAYYLMLPIKSGARLSCVFNAHNKAGYDVIVDAHQKAKVISCGKESNTPGLVNGLKSSSSNKYIWQLSIAITLSVPPSHLLCRNYGAVLMPYFTSRRLHKGPLSQCSCSDICYIIFDLFLVRHFVISCNLIRVYKQLVYIGSLSYIL